MDWILASIMTVFPVGRYFLLLHFHAAPHGSPCNGSDICNSDAQMSLFSVGAVRLVWGCPCLSSLVIVIYGSLTILYIVILSDYTKYEMEVGRCFSVTGI